MKISTRDKKILLMFLGVLFLALSYFFVYRPQMAEAETIESENVPLQTRLDELLEMANNKEFYEQETQEMQIKIKEYCDVFPADVRPEDGIVLTQNMENTMDMQISNVGLGDKEFIASLDGKTAEERAEEYEQTLMEKGAEITDEQIQEIEDTEGISEEEAIQKKSMEVTGDAALNYIDASFSPVLYRTQDTLQFVSTYNSLKEAVKYLAAQSGRMTLNDVSASFDSATGNLTGTMKLNLFSMTGTNSGYSEPDAGKVPYGTDNIFGTIEAPTKKKKASEKQAADGQNNQESEEAVQPAEENQEGGEAQ